MGQNTLAVCSASDYAGSEILELFQQVQVPLVRRWRLCGFVEVGSELPVCTFVGVPVTASQRLQDVCFSQSQEVLFFTFEVYLLLGFLPLWSCSRCLTCTGHQVEAE